VSQDEYFRARKLELDIILNIHITSLNLDTVPSIEYSGLDLVELEAEEKTWLMHPQKARTREYVTPCKEKALPAPQPQGPSDKLIRAEAGPESEEGVEEEEVVDELASELSLDSPPTSAFALNCRCGRQGDGNKAYSAELEGLAIQCHECNEWSHVACQRNARASNLRAKDHFRCDGCSLEGVLPTKTTKTSCTSGQR